MPRGPKHPRTVVPLASAGSINFPASQPHPVRPERRFGAHTFSASQPATGAGPNGELSKSQRKKLRKRKRKLDEANSRGGLLGAWVPVGMEGGGREEATRSSPTPKRMRVEELAVQEEPFIEAPPPANAVSPEAPTNDADHKLARPKKKKKKKRKAAESELMASQLESLKMERPRAEAEDPAADPLATEAAQVPEDQVMLHPEEEVATPFIKEECMPLEHDRKELSQLEGALVPDALPEGQENGVMYDDSPMEDIQSTLLQQETPAEDSFVPTDSMISPGQNVYDYVSWVDSASTGGSAKNRRRDKRVMSSERLHRSGGDAQGNASESQIATQSSRVPETPVRGTELTYGSSAKTHPSVNGASPGGSGKNSKRNAEHSDSFNDSDVDPQASLVSESRQMAASQEKDQEPVRSSSPLGESTNELLDPVPPEHDGLSEAEASVAPTTKLERPSSPSDEAESEAADQASNRTSAPTDPTNESSHEVEKAAQQPQRGPTTPGKYVEASTQPTIRSSDQVPRRSYFDRGGFAAPKPSLQQASGESEDSDGDGDTPKPIPGPPASVPKRFMKLTRPAKKTIPQGESESESEDADGEDEVDKEAAAGVDEDGEPDEQDLFTDDGPLEAAKSEDDNEPEEDIYDVPQSSYEPPLPQPPKRRLQSQTEKRFTALNQARASGGDEGKDEDEDDDYEPEDENPPPSPAPRSTIRSAKAKSSGKTSTASPAARKKAIAKASGPPKASNPSKPSTKPAKRSVQTSLSEDERKKLDNIISSYGDRHGLSQEELNGYLFEKGGTIKSEHSQRLWMAVYSAFPSETKRFFKRKVLRIRGECTRDPPWNKSDDTELAHLVEHHGKKWAMIGDVMKRNPSNCRDRYRNHAVCGDNRKIGKWTDEDNALLLRSVGKVIKEDRARPTPRNVSGKPYVDWNRVSALMDGLRSRQQCITKWERLRYDLDNPEVLSLLYGAHSGISIELRMARMHMYSMTEEQKMDIIYAIADHEAEGDDAIAWSDLKEGAVVTRWGPGTLALFWRDMRRRMNERYKAVSDQECALKLAKWLRKGGQLPPTDAGDEDQDEASRTKEEEFVVSSAGSSLLSTAASQAAMELDDEDDEDDEDYEDEGAEDD